MAGESLGPFIVHPIVVAALLGGLKMDADTVIAGLLHDAVEDTDMTFLRSSSCSAPWCGASLRFVDGDHSAVGPTIAMLWGSRCFFALLSHHRPR